MWKARFTPFENSLLSIDVSSVRRESDNSLRLWNIEDLAKPVPQHTFVGHSDVVTEFHWRKDSFGESDLYPLIVRHWASTELR